MFITRNDDKKVEFGTIPRGGVFMEDDQIYMVCDEIEKNGAKWNAADLETGQLCYFYADEKVVPLKAELIVS